MATTIIMTLLLALLFYTLLEEDRPFFKTRLDAYRYHLWSQDTYLGIHYYNNLPHTQQHMNAYSEFTGTSYMSAEYLQYK